MKGVWESGYHRVRRFIGDHHREQDHDRTEAGGGVRLLHAVRLRQVSLLHLMLDVRVGVCARCPVRAADHTHQSGAVPKPDQSAEVHGHAEAVGEDRGKLEGISG